MWGLGWQTLGCILQEDRIFCQALHVHPAQTAKLKEALGCLAGGYKKSTSEGSAGVGMSVGREAEK